CGALYGLEAPITNACKPPETWQSLDITFIAPRVDNNRKVTKKGEVSVLLNGVKVLDKVQFDQTTPDSPEARTSTWPLDQKVGTPGPLMLEDHYLSGSKVRFRNIRVKPIVQMTNPLRKLDKAPSQADLRYNPARRLDSAGAQSDWQPLMKGIITKK